MQLNHFVCRFPLDQSSWDRQARGAHPHLYDLRSAHFSPTFTVLFFFSYSALIEETDGNARAIPPPLSCVFSFPSHCCWLRTLFFTFGRLDPVDISTIVFVITL